MIASWLFELLRRESDWLAALPRIATHLSDLPDDRIRAALDLGAAFEHIEPDRYHAIIAYQLAGPGRDQGRSRFLAVEIGWWQADGRLALQDLKASGAHEALIAACRSLVDDDKRDAAQRLFAEHAADAEPALAGLRAELDGRTSEWKSYVASARKLSGKDAADAWVTAARLRRASGERDWNRLLQSALEVDPRHHVAAAMLMDLAVGSEEDSLVFEVMRLCLLGLDGYEYCDAVRAIATRLLLAQPSHHAGMGRRLARVALERAYAANLSGIPGHLALWTLLDRAAAQDGRRTELLPLLLRALDQPIPDSDRTWLAALGAAICVEAGSRGAARAYAAVVAEHAASHPIVRELLADAGPIAVDLDVRGELEALELDGATPPIETLVPEDLEIDLAPVTMTPADRPTVTTYRPDPRFVDVSVPALDDVPAASPSTSRFANAAAPAPVSPSLPRTAPSPAPPSHPPAARPPSLASAPAPHAAPPQPASAQPTVPVQPTAAVAPAIAAGSIDEQWDVDDELFPRRRRSSALPPLPAPSSVAPVAAPAPAVVAPAPKVPVRPAPAAAALSSIIPKAALRVLQQAGAPRPLPRVPPPANAVPRAERVPLAVDLRIQHQGQAIHVHTRDFSLTGFFAITSVAFEVGAVVECEIRMPVRDELAAKHISARAKIVRRDLGGYGFALIDPPAALVDAIGAHEQPRES